MPIHRQAVKKEVDLTVAREQQPQGVQVVEWVGLVVFSLQETLNQEANYPLQ